MCAPGWRKEVGGVVDSVRKGVRWVAALAVGLGRGAVVGAKRVYEHGGWPWYLAAVVGAVVAVRMVVLPLGAATRTPHVFAATTEDQSLEFVLDGLSVDPKPLPGEAGEARVRASMAKTSKYCGALEPEQQKFCEHMLNRDLLTEWNSYKNGREESCEWSERRDFGLFYAVTSEDEYYNMSTARGDPLYDITVSSWISEIRGDMWPLPNYEPRSPLSTNHDKVMQECSFTAERGEWHVTRVGPFNNRKVGSWHYVWFQPFPELDISLPGNIGKYQVATLTSISNERGEIVGYPPAHMHHFHVWNVDPLKPIWPHVTFNGFETHGDDMCDHAGLGSVCYMKTWPPGYGLSLPPRYFFEALANFVAESTDEDFYFEISVLVSDDPRTVPTIPFVAHAPDMLSKIPQQAGTYEVPKEGESMTWGLETVQFDFELLWWKFHTHYYFTSEAWVLDGDATDALGLGKAPFELYLEPFTKADWQDHDTPKLADVYEDASKMIEERFPIPGANVPYKQRYLDLGTVDLDHESAKELLLARLKAHNDRVDPGDGSPCHTCIKFLWQIDNVMDFHDEVAGKMWTRRPFTPPTRSTFRAGEKMTIIVFHKRNYALCGDTCGESKQPARLHFLIDCTTRMLDPVISFFPSTNGQWLIYYATFRPTLLLFFVLLALTAAVASCACLLLKGKCLPLRGPCAPDAPDALYRDDEMPFLAKDPKPYDEETKEALPSDASRRRRISA